MENLDSKRRILEDIKRMKSGSLEQMYLITVYGLEAYFKSLFAFGKDNKITRDNLNVIREMFRILKTERIFLNYILRHLDEFDISATEDVVAMLDEANDKAVIFYYDVIDGIEDAVDLQEEWRGIRRKQDYPTLTQSTTYAKEVVALGENAESLKQFLGFETDFWSYIKDKVQEADCTCEEVEGMFYAKPLLDPDSMVVGIHVLVPKVVDLRTALLAISIYNRAHDIYNMIGQTYDDSKISECDLLQQEYEEQYIAEKADKLLKKDIK